MKSLKHVAGIAALGSFVLGGILSVALLVGALDVGSDGADEASTSALPEQAGDAGSNVASDSGFDEGIQVHGDWVIEVRNPDGSVAERREFQNALTSPASHYLDLVMARTASVGEWGVTLVGTPDSCGAGGNCFISEAGGTHNWGIAADTQFATLVLSAEQNPNEFVLQGNFDAPIDTSISEVHTLACIRIPPSLNPAECNNTSTFTFKQLQSPVNVITGQQVLVTVRISFS